MDPIRPEDRKVANINDGAFVAFIADDGSPDGEVLQVNGGRTGYGFHVYRMAPGTWTVGHEHVGDEEFLLIEGDLKDHDGYEYRPGDLVCLKSGTRHNSYSETGCVLAVYLRDTK